MIPVASPPAIVAPESAPAPVPSREPEPGAGAAPNVVFVELLGSGLLYSINYERLVPQWNIGLRAGASFFAYKVSRAEGSGALDLASFPILASWYVGTERHKLQLGLGATLLFVSASTDATGAKYESTASGWGLAASGVVGYRYFPPRGGFTFGAGFTPLLRAEKGFLAWGGANAGYAF